MSIKNAPDYAKLTDAAGMLDASDYHVSEKDIAAAHTIGAAESRGYSAGQRVGAGALALGLGAMTLMPGCATNRPSPRQQLESIFRIARAQRENEVRGKQKDFGSNVKEDIYLARDANGKVNLDSLKGPVDLPGYEPVAGLAVYRLKGNIEGREKPYLVKVDDDGDGSADFIPISEKKLSDYLVSLRTEGIVPANDFVWRTREQIKGKGLREYQLKLKGETVPTLEDSPVLEKPVVEVPYETIAEVNVDENGNLEARTGISVKFNGARDLCTNTLNAAMNFGYGLAVKPFRMVATDVDEDGNVTRTRKLTLKEKLWGKDSIWSPFVMGENHNWKKGKRAEATGEISRWGLILYGISQAFDGGRKGDGTRIIPSAPEEPTPGPGPGPNPNPTPVIDSWGNGTNVGN
jgi:hypothetical protein